MPRTVSPPTPRPPELPRGLNQGSPLSRGLLALFDPLSSRAARAWRDLRLGTEAEPHNSARVEPDAELGWAFAFNPATSDDATTDGSRFNFHQNSRFTVAAWVRPQSATDGCIVSHVIPFGLRGWHLSVTAVGDQLWPYFAVQEADNSYIMRLGDADLANGRWHHVAAVFSGDISPSSIRLYVDGVEQTGGYDSTGSLYFVACDQPLRIGSRGAEGFFHGKLGPIAIYSVDLAPDLLRVAADPRHRWDLLAAPRRKIARASDNDTINAATALRTFTRVSARALASLVGSGALAASTDAAISGELLRTLAQADFRAPGWAEFPAPPTSTGGGAVMSQSASAAHPDEVQADGDAAETTPGAAVVELAPGGDTAYLERLMPGAMTLLHTRFAVNASDFTDGQAVVLQGLGAEGEMVFAVAVTMASIGLGLADEEPIVVTPPTSMDAAAWRNVEIAIDRNARTATLWIDDQLCGITESGGAIAAVARLRFGAPSRSGDASGVIRLSRWSIGSGRLGPAVTPVPRLATLADPARWLVVYNRDDADSRAWVQTYRQARSTPLANLVGLSLPTAEHITGQQADIIADALHDAMALRPPGAIRGVLLGHRVPAFAEGRPIEARLAPIATWHDDDGERAALLTRNHLVFARLDGESLADADALTARAIAIAETPMRENDAVVLSPQAGGPTPWREWQHTPAAQRLHMMMEAIPELPTPPATPLSNDAFLIAVVPEEPGESAAGVFGSRSRPRVLAVFLPDGDVLPTLRGAESWPEVALGAGYAAVCIATRSNADALNLVVLFESLRRGRTLADAFVAALPSDAAPGDWVLVGDPLLTLVTPAAGWRVLGPVSMLESLDSDAVAVELPASARSVALPLAAQPSVNHTARWLLRNINAFGQSDVGVASVRAVSLDNTARPLPLPPIFPAHAGWRVARQGNLISPCIVMDRSFMAARVERIDLLAQDANGNETLVAQFVPRCDASSFSCETELADAPLRFAFRLTTADGASETTPWSTLIAPAAPPTIALSTLEA